MRRLACFVFLLVGCTRPETAAVDVARAPIVNGTRDPRAVELSDAQVLAIGWLHRAGRPGNNFCTGTLFEKNLVATAQHCVAGSSAEDIGFSIGLDPSDPVASFEVEGVYEHPSADAAFLKLAGDATALDTTVTPIAPNLAPLERTLIGSAVQAGGYGDTRDRGRSGRWFATVYLDSIADDEVVVDGRGDQGICYGDSGGPLIIPGPGGTPLLAAVESWGDSSCVGRDHMTRLDAIAEWWSPLLRGEEPYSECGDIEEVGRCNGAVAEWCNRGSLRQLDCASLGSECAFVNEEIGHYCLCGSLDYLGRCSGDTAEYCDRNGLFRRVNCAARDLRCGYVDDEIGFFCTDEPQCPPELTAGRCDGDVLETCDRGTLLRTDCGESRCITGDDGASCGGTGPAGDAGRPSIGIRQAPAITTTPAPELRPRVRDGGGCSATTSGSPSDPWTAAPWFVLVVGLLARGRRRPR